MSRTHPEKSVSDQQSVFLGRGYRDTFVENEKASMRTPLDEETKEKSLAVARNSAADTNRVEAALEAGQVYAWAARLKERSAIAKMTPGDWFLLRTRGSTRDNRYFEHVLRIDAVWTRQSPTARSLIANHIWDDPQYKLLWFGTEYTPVNISENAFNELINDGEFDFDFVEYMAGRGAYSSIRQLPECYLEPHGGAAAFIERVKDRSAIDVD